MNNPFVTNGYAGEHYFCDRVTETQSLTELLCNGNNVALISPRRLGKTDLIKHCFAQDEIKNQYYTFVVDVYATTSLREFVNALGKSIIEALKPKGKRIMQRFVDVVASLRADVTFDVFGQPSWGVGVGTMKDPETSLDEIFKFLEQADHHCIVAIDEFQQIASYSDAPNIEAQLRTH
ncbi:MAG: ATPase, partial [Muribaculaceae bacterium]|nr:ATPase [Muribaculaceae bacterium]